MHMKAATMGNSMPSRDDIFPWLYRWSSAPSPFSLISSSASPNLETTCNQSSTAWNWLGEQLGTQVRLSWLLLPAPSVRKYQQSAKACCDFSLASGHSRTPEDGSHLQAQRIVLHNGGCPTSFHLSLPSHSHSSALHLLRPLAQSQLVPVEVEAILLDSLCMLFP